MIDWTKLYNKFGQSISSKKFEDMSLDYVQNVYSQYKWVPTKRTHDGNKDFHSLETELLNIWGEAKYKKDSTKLTKKDLDPTILSGLMDGTVQLIIFVTNGQIPQPLIERIYLSAKIKNIKISFVLEKQLSDWLILNPQKYYFYFEEEINTTALYFNQKQVVEVKNISFYELISLDMKPNIQKVNMNIGETFILNCTILATREGKGSFFVEDDFPFSFIKHKDYDFPENCEIRAGINIYSFMILAKQEFCNILHVGFRTERKDYYFLTPKIIIKRNKQLPIVFYKQLGIINTIENAIKNYDFSMGNYIFFIHGYSGMGKSYILNKISKDYAINNDITLLEFEKSEQSNYNFLLLCKIIIYLHLGNVFWDYSLTNLKKVCFFNKITGYFDEKLLNNILEGCHDANIAKATILDILSNYKHIQLIPSIKNKHFRILVLDDVHFLSGKQSEFFQLLIHQQLLSQNNNVIILSGTKNKFYNIKLEKFLKDKISNYYTLDSLSEKDIKATILKQFNSCKNIEISNVLIKSFPLNLLMFCELLHGYFNFRYTQEEVDEIRLLEQYIELYDQKLVFQNKFFDLNEKFYLLDILYLFPKGLDSKYLYKHFSKPQIKKDLLILEEKNCIRIKGNNMIIPYHDYMLSNYKKLRKGKEYNSKTGAFIEYLIQVNNANFDMNNLLYIISKCGRSYYNLYKKKNQDLMLKYIEKTQYGAAKYFAELFYESISHKNILSSKDKYFLYLYADCLVHCDNKYQATRLLKHITENSAAYSFEKYEANISLLNQRFWSINIEGIIEDSKIYQVDLENMYMHNLPKALIGRFKKAYEACFNRRMVTFLLTDRFDMAQMAYREGLFALKKMSNIFNLDYESEIATIIMDYARGNMAHNIKKSYRLLAIASRIFYKNKEKYVRRNILSQIDMLVAENILGKRVNYREIKVLTVDLKNNHFTLEYVKSIMKICACRLIDYCRSTREVYNQYTCDYSTEYEEIKNTLENCIIDNQIVLQNRERFLFNNLIAFIYIKQKKIKYARYCLEKNQCYIINAGKSYHIPLEHNLMNLDSIKGIEWFQVGKVYSADVYLLETRFW